jgi:pimeloyl-ACP methyl ester carboxylesterase
MSKSEINSNIEIPNPSPPNSACGFAFAEPCRHEQSLSLAEALNHFEHEAFRRVCDTGRYRCPFYIWGDGPPLVFIHGLCDDARSFVLPIAHLSRHFRCIAYDLPGNPDDGGKLSRYQHADLVADLHTLLDHLGLKSCSLVGSSFGSTIALRAMHSRPERFPSAVLQGGFARRPLALPEVLLAKLARYWPWHMHQLPLRVPIIRRAHFSPFASGPTENWDYFLERSGAPIMAAVARRALILHQLDLRDLLPDIRQPILLVCGDADPLVDKKCEEVLQAGLPNATRAELHNCGHMPQFTHPEVLAELILRFLMPLPCADHSSAPPASRNSML